jgi:hypothetical protein
MPLFSRVAINLLYKLFLFPVTLSGFSVLFPSLLHFSSWLQILSIAGLFIMIGLIADETILPKFGNIKATAQGSIFMSVVIWLSQFLFPTSLITIPGAIQLGLLLGMIEWLMHGWILKQRKIMLEKN